MTVLLSFGTSSTTTAGAASVTWTFTSWGPPEDPPPAGVREPRSPLPDDPPVLAAALAPGGG